MCGYIHIRWGFPGKKNLVFFSEKRLPVSSEMHQGIAQSNDKRKKKQEPKNKNLLSFSGKHLSVSSGMHQGIAPINDKHKKNQEPKI